MAARPEIRVRINNRREIPRAVTGGSRIVRKVGFAVQWKPQWTEGAFDN